MSELTNIMDDSVYLARDYSSIIKWLVNKLKYLTTKWTDLTVSEPDTLSLSYIAHAFDLINYKVDYKYLSTLIDITDSRKFLSDLYKITGSELEDYESGLITADLTNKSSYSLTINKYDTLMMRDHPDELFTVLNSYEIPAKSAAQIEFVRGTLLYEKHNKSDLVNGYIVLKDSNINRKSVNILINGESELVRSKDDALFDEEDSFSVYQKDDRMTSIRLSPSAYNSITDYVLIVYTINDNYPVANKSILKIIKYISDEYLIETNDDSVLPSYTINEMKYKYYNNLYDLKTLFNENYDISSLKFGRIDYLSYDYDLKSNFKSGSINYTTGVVDLNIVILPDTDIKIYYILTNDDGSVRQEEVQEVTLSSISELIQLDNIEEGLSVEPMSLLINVDDTVIGDTEGNNKIDVISGVSSLVLNYSTSDDNPITNMLDVGSIYYETSEILINFRYVPSEVLSVFYKYINNDIEYNKTEYFSITASSLRIKLDTPDGSSIVPGTLTITDGYNVIKDLGESYLVQVKSDYTELIDRLKSMVLLSKYLNMESVIVNKLSIRYIDVSAIAYIDATDISIDNILKDITDALNKSYAKGMNPSGESIKKLLILSTIKNSNSAINYVKLLEPTTDISVDYTQIPMIGSINISFERNI